MILTAWNKKQSTGLDSYIVLMGLVARANLLGLVYLTTLHNVAMKHWVILYPTIITKCIPVPRESIVTSYKFISREMCKDKANQVYLKKRSGDKA